MMLSSNSKIVISFHLLNGIELEKRLKPNKKIAFSSSISFKLFWRSFRNDVTNTYYTNTNTKITLLYVIVPHNTIPFPLKRDLIFTLLFSKFWFINFLRCVVVVLEQWFSTQIAPWPLYLKKIPHPQWRGFFG